MPWLIVQYLPVGLFSLKHGEATSTGGKSLLVPTPFAIRTALVDAALRLEGRDRARAIVDTVKRLKLALKPPRYAAVSGLFTKVLKPERRDSAKAAQRFFQKTIAFREYVHWWGELGLAFGGQEADLQAVARWLPHITYLGKRGGFVQLAGPPERAATLPQGYLVLEPRGRETQGFPLGLVQRVDDWGKAMTWDALNVFSDAKIRLGKERVRYDIPVPYAMLQAGRGFTVYAVE